MMLGRVLRRSRITVALFLAALVLTAGCSAERSLYEAERDVTVTETVSPQSGIVGTWAHISGDSRTVMVLETQGRGTVWVHTTHPNTPGISAPFPFTYSLDRDVVTLEFEDGGKESFSIGGMSAGAFEAEASTAETWTADGVWVRAE